MSCADVCVTVDGWDGPSFESHSVVRARKDHTCNECGLIIERGSHYEKASGLWEDSFYSFKTCLDCAEVRDAFFCYGWQYGSVWDDIKEQLFYDVEKTGIWDCLAKLDRLSARRKLASEFESWLEWRRGE